MKYVIYAIKDCPYCDKLYDYMIERDMEFAYVMVHNMDKDLQKIKDAHNWSTVPIVFEGGEFDGDEKFIGGCSDTIALLEKRRLKENPP